jgi:energy-converting hydrogenase Eha subunit A
VKTNSATKFLLTSAAIAMSWPIALAHVGLRLAFVRPYIVSEASSIALPVSLGFAIMAVAILHRWQPKEAIAWFFTCAILGAILSDVWLALGEYVHANRSIGAFGRTLVGGVLFAVPIGLVVGMVLGLEIVALKSWHSRSKVPDSWWPLPVIAVVTNIAVAAMVYYGTASIRQTH